MPEGMKDEVAARLRIVQYHDGDTVVRQGQDDNEGIFFIRCGLCHILVDGTYIGSCAAVIFLYNRRPGEHSP